MNFKTKHYLYDTWNAMIQRCHNENSSGYYLYGAREIIVCEEWKKDFWAFVSDVGDKPTSLHSLDRINNNGNYEKHNVRWATKIEQAKNRRTNVYLYVDGRKLTISEASEIYNIDKSFVFSFLVG